MQSINYFPAIKPTVCFASPNVNPQGLYSVASQAVAKRCPVVALPNVALLYTTESPVGHRSPILEPSLPIYIMLPSSKVLRARSVSVECLIIQYAVTWRSQSASAVNTDVNAFDGKR